MIEFLAPWGFPAFLVVLLFIVIWLTDWIAFQRGRRSGIEEANERNLFQMRNDFQSGCVEGVRRAIAWLRANGYSENAALLPKDELTERQLWIDEQ